MNKDEIIKKANAIWSGDVKYPYNYVVAIMRILIGMLIVAGMLLLFGI